MGNDGIYFWYHLQDGEQVGMRTDTMEDSVKTGYLASETLNMVDNIVKPATPSSQPGMRGNSGGCEISKRWVIDTICALTRVPEGYW